MLYVNYTSKKEASFNKQKTQVFMEHLKIPWRREWQSTPVFLPGESHGQRSLGGYSPQGRKESDMTEATSHPRTQLKVQVSTWTFHWHLKSKVG